MTNKYKTNSSLYGLILLLVFSFLIQSCGTQKNGTVKIEKSQDISIPVKILVGDIRGDSTWTRLLIPTEFYLMNTFNSRIKLSDGHLSLKGGNVSSSPVILLTKNKLDLGFRDIKFDKNEKKHFKVYTSYKLLLSNQEKDQILNKAKFAQYMFTSKKEVYDIDTLKDTPSFLLNKVPDSLKGFIRMYFYDFITKKRFAKNIPVDF
ncbi:hypothetical protein ACSTS3_04680 [Aquimarina muelleri]|uniref:hypothetical protein n=1 Tax=Aquimarina muelleri TaxID=279356 RepID=UPI003F68545C